MIHRLDPTTYIIESPAGTLRITVKKTKQRGIPWPVYWITRIELHGQVTVEGLLMLLSEFKKRVVEGKIS